MSRPGEDDARPRAYHRQDWWPDAWCRQVRSIRSRIPERRPRGSLFGTPCRAPFEVMFCAPLVCRTRTSGRERESSAFQWRRIAPCFALVPPPPTFRAGVAAEGPRRHTGAAPDVRPAVPPLRPRVGPRSRREAAAKADGVAYSLRPRAAIPRQARHTQRARLGAAFVDDARQSTRSQYGGILFM